MKILKTCFLICTVLLLKGCSDDDDPKNPIIEEEEEKEFIISMDITYNEGVYSGKINHDSLTISFDDIKYGANATVIAYQLSEDVTIDPDPKSYEQKLTDNLVFSLTKGDKTKDYKLILNNYVGLNEEVDPNDDYPSDDSWKLAWEDEFEGSEIDWSVWSKTKRGNSDWNNYMSSVDELFEVKDGILTLKAIANTNYPNDKSPYLTGGLTGKGKKSFDMENGRIDVRARFDSGQGFWPAIWMLGDVNISWPVNGEIDIMEHLNFDNYVYQTLHTKYTTEESKTNPPASQRTNINKDEFNVYSVEIYENELVFLVNDEVTHRYPKLDSATPAQYPFTAWNFYVILSAQLGGNWVGNPNPEHLPLQMDIDWVRFYEKSE